MTFKWNLFWKGEIEEKQTYSVTFLPLKNLQIQTNVSIAISEKLITVESIPPDFNWTKYDRFALPDRESGEPVLVFINLALSQIIDLRY